MSEEFADGAMVDNRRFERRQGSIATLTRDDLAHLIAEAIRESSPTSALTEEETKWVRLAIKEQAKRAEWRNAAIKHTTLVLLGLFVVWFASHAFDILASIVDYFRANATQPPKVK